MIHTIAGPPAIVINPAWACLSLVEDNKITNPVTAGNADNARVSRRNPFFVSMPNSLTTNRMRRNNFCRGQFNRKFPIMPVFLIRTLPEAVFEGLRLRLKVFQPLLLVILLQCRDKLVHLAQDHLIETVK